MNKLIEIKEIIAILKASNRRKVVFTNGCFDILHSGHVKYLELSKSYGDILIVGLNSDDSIRRLKGKNRPINNQLNRAYMLNSLEAVDYVIIFNEDTPYNLINQIKPNILTKGADYSQNEVVGADIVDDVKLIDLFDQQSTTGIINKIKELE